MKDESLVYLKDCTVCAERDAASKVPTPMDHLHACYPHELVSTDIMGPLPLTKQGNRYIITFTCHFTKFNMSVAIKDTTATSILSSLMTY
jgi:hypothetical protein